jgi:CPA2 family monovalent cation:H+ antiporter-2
MAHQTPLISLLVLGLSLAFILGWAASRLRMSPIVGYLAAGVMIGPFTPGFVADGSLAAEVAEVGAMLLMFGVGLHFTPRELMSVRAIAAPAALAQILIATLAGAVVGLLTDWGVTAGMVFGLCLSIASTVVAMRTIQDQRATQSDRGRITVGWLVMEDFAMILVMVLLPTWAQISRATSGEGEMSSLQMQDIGLALALTVGKVIAFVVLMLVAGRRVVPWILHRVVHSGSRELFRLAVLAIAMGSAFAAASFFDVSLALGALFAGLIMAESELSQQAAHETLPLRDAFAVLFFVSVGMLFDPMILIRNPWPLLLTVFTITVLRTALGYGLLRVMGQSHQMSLSVTASRSQIGEFSFIVAGLGVSLGLMPDSARDLIVGAAIFTICLTPATSFLLDRVSMKAPAFESVPAGAPSRAVLVGHGRVGSIIAASLRASGAQFAVIEDREDIVHALKERGVAAIAGNGASPDRLSEAGIDRAEFLFVTVPDGFEAGGVVESARSLNPRVRVYARAHSDAEVEHLTRLGADVIISGEREIADAMISDVRPRLSPAR